MSTVTVTATVEASNVPPRVRLQVTDTGTPAVTRTTVTRLDPDGTARPVRTEDGSPLELVTSGTNRVGLLFDYEMPLGVPVYYSTVESPTVVTTARTVTSSKSWLAHPGVPDLSQPILIAKVGDRTRKVERGVFYPMGRKTPVVNTDGARKSAEFTLSLYTASDAERYALDDLLDDAGVLMLNIPADKGFGNTTEYVSVGDLTEQRRSPMLVEPVRTWDLPCTVVDMPAGGSQPQRNLDDLKSFASLTALSSAYASFDALLAGP